MQSAAQAPVLVAAIELFDTEGGLLFHRLTCTAVWRSQLNAVTLAAPGSGNIRGAEMDPAENYRALARYNTWMNRRIYALCRTLPDEERKRDVGAFFKSVHGTLNHILMADHVWLIRCGRNKERYSPRTAGGDIIALRSYEQVLYDDFSEMAAQRKTTDKMIEDWTNSLTSTELAGPVQYQALQPHEHPLWWCVTHLFNHQAHHRGQLTTILMQLGHDPGITDFLPHMRGAVDLEGA
jgi:uncharacterized damage-inducible protein DinB